MVASAVEVGHDHRLGKAADPEDVDRCKDRGLPVVDELASLGLAVDCTAQLAVTEAERRSHCGVEAYPEEDVDNHLVVHFYQAAFYRMVEGGRFDLADHEVPEVLFHPAGKVSR